VLAARVELPCSPDTRVNSKQFALRNTHPQIRCCGCSKYGHVKKKGDQVICPTWGPDVPIRTQTEGRKRWMRMCYGHCR
jgi:hypothetical protein